MLDAAPQLTLTQQFQCQPDMKTPLEYPVSFLHWCSIARNGLPVISPSCPVRAFRRRPRGARRRGASRDSLLAGGKAGSEGGGCDARPGCGPGGEVRRCLAFVSVVREEKRVCIDVGMTELIDE